MKGLYNVVIIGFGGMGQEHCKKISSIGRMKVIGAYDIDEEVSSIIFSHNIENYTSFDNVLSDDKVDVIVIATPNNSHSIIALHALASGKHVICEKPAMMNSNELKRVVSFAEKQGLVFMVHQNRRWDSDYLTIKNIKDSGIIGDIFHFETRVHGSRGIPGDWRHVKHEGGGMLMDWGVHLVDRLLQLIPNRIESIYAELSYVLGHEVDDGARINFKFEGGVTAIVEIGTTNFISLPKWYVTGLSGSAVIYDWEMNGSVVKLIHSDGKDVKPIEAGAGLTKTMAPRIDDSISHLPLPIISGDVRNFYENFIDVIEGKNPPIIKNEHAIHVLEILECAVTSHENKEVIHF